MKLRVDQCVDGFESDFGGLQEDAMQYERAQSKATQQINSPRDVTEEVGGHQMRDNEHPGEFAAGPDRHDERL